VSRRLECEAEGGAGTKFVVGQRQQEPRRHARRSGPPCFFARRFDSRTWFFADLTDEVQE
jgi:hypothetical protein